MKMLKKMFLYTLGFGVLGYVVGLIFTYFVGGYSSISPKLFTDSTTLIVLAIGAIGGFVLAVSKPIKESTKAKTSAKTASGHEHALHFDSHFLSRDEILKTYGLINTTWNQLPSIKNTGLVVRNCLEGKNLEITMKDEVHALIIGTTGSGISSIQRMSICKR